MLDALIELAGRVPAAVVYLALGVGAGLENVLPAVPADTFVLLGGFLSEVGNALDPWWVFFVTWGFNSAGALAIYRLGCGRGRRFFTGGWGRRILNPHQMERMRGFYARFGRSAIFFTRFLPGLRSIVPIFAGVSQQPFWSVAPPLVVASALWYGGLVWAGTVAGRNLDRVRTLLSEVNGGLLTVAVLLVGGAGIWWWRTRHHGVDHEGP